MSYTVVQLQQRNQKKVAFKMGWSNAVLLQYIKGKPSFCFVSSIFYTLSCLLLNDSLKIYRVLSWELLNNTNAWYVELRFTLLYDVIVSHNCKLNVLFILKTSCVWRYKCYVPSESSWFDKNNWPSHKICIMRCL